MMYADHASLGRAAHTREDTGVIQSARNKRENCDSFKKKKKKRVPWREREPERKYSRAGRNLRSSSAARDRGKRGNSKTDASLHSDMATKRVALGSSCRGIMFPSTEARPSLHSSVPATPRSQCSALGASWKQRFAC